MDRLKYWLKLKLAPEVGHQTALKLLELYGDPETWTNETLSMALEQRLICYSAYDWFISDKGPKNWLALCKYIHTLGIKYTTVLDDDYPYLLKNIYAPPLILYYRGDLKSALHTFNLGVVGTRKPTAYGKQMTECIVEPLAKNGITIVSGLAFGIDTIAHETALKANGSTIAVLAHGLEQIYPLQNRELAKKIIDKGAIISEYEPGTKMERWNFPTRNRIISGISQGTLVVEGSLTSGALLTAKFAIEQNRELFAIPGQVNVINAEGPNNLIKQGAKLVTSAEDILQDFGLEFSQSIQTEFLTILNPTEQAVYDIFSHEQRELSFDDLLLRTGYSIGQLSIVLLNLELKKIIRKSNGNCFILI